MLNVRYFLRLPPVLRVARIAGLLLALAALVLFLQMLPTWLSTSHWPADFPQVFTIAWSLIALSLSCSLVVYPYDRHARRSGRGAVALDSWQSQVRALLVSTALPLCALVLAVVIPPTQPGYENIFFITILAMFVSLVANLWLLGRHRAAH